MTYDEFRILNEKPLLSVEEAAELTGLGQHIIRAMAADKNINYVFLPGIPGKYSPYTAAEIILKTIENIIAESGKDAKLWIYGKKE